MLVHNPQAYPEMSGKAIVIEPGKENFVSVSASYTEGYVYIQKLFLYYFLILMGNFTTTNGE